MRAEETKILNAENSCKLTGNQVPAPFPEKAHDEQ